MPAAFTAAQLVLAALAAGAATPPSPDREGLDHEFDSAVRPFLQTYCVDCHGGDSPEGELNLGRFESLGAVTAEFRRWETVRDQLRGGTMPPADAKQPGAEARKGVIEWITRVRAAEAVRNAGDPGPVPARRLSNAEYDNTIRDLTGVDLRPTREFPVDPANEAGFDNSGESLSMSPALLRKYLEAARTVADHAVLLPDGIAFAPYPVVADTDRDKWAVRRIIDFYKRQPTDYADYFEAAWRYHHRDAFGRHDATLAEIASEAKISPRYLETIWATLTTGKETVGPVAALRALWRELPRPDAGKEPASVRPASERMRGFVIDVRRQVVPKIENLTAPRINDGSQPLVLWKNRQMAANRMRYSGGALRVRVEGLPEGSAAARAMEIPADAAEAEKFESTLDLFCSVFPDAFVVSERARVFLDPEQEKHLTGRLLSAGFHNQMGYFRDDGPLSELILDDAGRRELDRLWDEFDVVTGAPMRQHSGFLWFERAESGFMRDEVFDAFRAEDKDAWSEARIAELAEVYLAKARRVGAGEVALEAIAEHFRRISASIRRVEELRAAGEPRHVAALQEFAGRAFRRPLSPEERNEIAAFYRSLRDEDGLSHEDAVRDTFVRILMSPSFCFRIDESVPGDGAVRPLTESSVASRLSYLLWSSMPDRELLDLAAKGELSKPEVLRGQVRRMLADDRVRGLANEFAGNWLDVRRFEEHNAVDRGRFPQFDDELRRAMSEEPIRFFIDLVRRDGSVFELVEADHTFVNPVLARHYGMPEPTGGPDDWVRVDDAGRYGRGGLLPMAAFLTKNSPGLRTSPVKRGYWVVRRIIGEQIPPPPAAVPELPSDEAKLGDLTLRELLARHREHASCAVCHDRFDALGLAFEGYGPIGEVRTVDLGGKPVDARAAFPGGDEAEGLSGLREYLRSHRRQEFIDNFCRKLLAYALGRGLLPSDDEVVRDMQERLAGDGGKFGGLVEVIVTSPQFLNKRAAGGPAGVAGEPR